MTDIDEEVVRNRRDPRRESSLPPAPRGAPSEAPVPDVTELLASEAPPARVEAEPPPARVEAEPPARVEAAAAVPATRSAVTSADPRLDEIEPLLRAGDWDAVLRALGPDENAGRLPPNLGLLYAVARREKESATGDAGAKKAGAAEEPKAIDATELAIRCTAGLLGVSSESAVALVVAKRLLRKNPVAWQQRPAPPASITAMIIVAALVIGSALGWLVASGHVQITFRR